MGAMNRPAAPASSSLATSLRLGAVYDWILGAAIIATPPTLLSALRFPPPADTFLFRLAALPLVLFPFVYLHAARHPTPQAGAVRLSVLLRGVGGTILGLLALTHRPAGAGVYLAIAFADLAWAGLHAALAARAKGKATGV